MNTTAFPPYQQRVVDEKEELGKKLISLTVFFESETYFNLSFDEQLRMLRQLTAMQLYFDALKDRIDGFSNPGDSAMARHAHIMSLQLNEAMRDQTDSYMVGLYNGMLLICCNEDNVDYRPIQALKGVPGQGSVVQPERTLEQRLADTAAYNLGALVAPYEPDEDTGLVD